jgi:rabenosyn-5
MAPNVTPPPVSQSPSGQSRADGDITLQASSEPPAAISLPPRVEFPPQSAPSTSSHVLESSDATVVVQAPSPLIPAMSIPLLGEPMQAEASGSSETLMPTPQIESRFKQLPRKPTTFRHVPVRSANGVRGPFPSPLRPASMHSRSGSTSSNASRVLEQHPQSQVTFPTHKQPHELGRLSSISSTFSNMDHPLPAIPIVDTSPSRALSVDSRMKPRTSSLNGATNKLPTPAPTPPSISPAPSSSASIPASTSASRSTTPAPVVPVAPRPSAPYRPGFQPKGVYRPLTESFISLRQSRSAANRTERTKLERRLEKLIQLHFPTDSEPEKGRRPSVRERRASSIFDLDFSDPGGLWRGVIQGQGGKADVRGMKSHQACRLHLGNYQAFCSC